MSEKKQVLKNSFVAILATASRVIIGFWLTTYLVDNLGKVAYGFVPMAYMMSEYIVFITTSLQGAVARYLTIEIRTNNWKEGIVTFNTALRSNAVLALVQLPVLVCILFNLNNIFSIPSELEHDVFYLMLFAGVAFVGNVAFSVFNAPIFANNRLDISRSVEITLMISRTMLIVVFFVIDSPHIYYASLAHLVASILSNSITLFYWRKLTPRLVLKPTIFDKAKLKGILSISVWTTIGFVGMLLFDRSGILIANRFVGVAESSEWAIAEQWRNAVMALVSILSSLVVPIILAVYARKDFDRLKKIVTMSIKINGIFLSIICGIVAVQSRNLLVVWMGEDFAHVWPILSILVISIPITASTNSLNAVFISYNRVKAPAIQYLALGIVYIAVAIVLSKYTTLDLYGIAISGMVLNIIYTTVVMPLYCSIVMKLKLSTFFPPLLFVLSSTLIVVLVTLPSIFFNINSWTRLIISTAIAGFLVLPVLWILILRKEDRQFVIEIFPKKFQGSLSRLNW